MMLLGNMATCIPPLQVLFKVPAGVRGEILDAASIILDNIQDKYKKDTRTYNHFYCLFSGLADVSKEKRIEIANVSVPLLQSIGKDWFLFAPDLVIIEELSTEYRDSVIADLCILAQKLAQTRNRHGLKFPPQSLIHLLAKAKEKWKFVLSLNNMFV